MTAVCGGRGIGGVPEAGVIFRVLGDMVATDMGRCTRCGGYAPLQGFRGSYIDSLFRKRPNDF